MFCPGCGKEIVAGALHCPACGTAIPQAQVPQAQVPQAQAPQAQAPQAQAPQAQAPQAQAPQAQAPSPHAAAPLPQSGSSALPDEVTQFSQKSQDYSPHSQYFGQPQQSQGFGQQPQPQSQGTYQSAGVSAAKSSMDTVSRGTASRGTASGGTASGGGVPPKKSGKLKIMLAVAIGVVLLCGAFAAALFSGVLEDIFPSASTTTQVADNEDEDEDDEETATEEVSESTTAAVTSAPTTATAPSTTATTTVASEPETPAQTDEWDTDSINYRPDEELDAMLLDMDITPYRSGSSGGRAAVEETLVNGAKGYLGALRNSSMILSPGSGNIYGGEINLDIDIPDAYLDELLALSFGSPESITPQIREIARVAAASGMTVSAEVADDPGSQLFGMMMGMDYDWRVGSQSLLHAKAYIDDEEALISFPEISSYVLRTVVPELSDIDYSLSALLEQQTMMMQVLEKLPAYADEAMPYVEEILLAGISELDMKPGSPVSAKLGGRAVEFETLDIVLTESSSARALIAALETYLGNDAAVDLTVDAANEIFTTLQDMTVTKDMVVAVLNAAIDRLEPSLTASDSQTVYYMHIYLNDGVVSGASIEVANETWTNSVTPFGFFVDDTAGYQMWFEPMAGSTTGEVSRNRYELFGTLTEGSNGISGDLNIGINEDGESFTAKLLTFSDIGYASLFGVATTTGSCEIRLSDIYDAFEGQEDSGISFVSEAAYMLDPTFREHFYDLVITLNSSVENSESGISLTIANPVKDAGISLGIKGYILSGSIEKPQGTMFDTTETPEQEAVMALISDAQVGIGQKIDALVAAGYDVSWVKEQLAMMIYSSFPGTGAQNPAIGEQYSEGAAEAYVE